MASQTTKVEPPVSGSEHTGGASRKRSTTRGFGGVSRVTRESISPGTAQATKILYTRATYMHARPSPQHPKQLVDAQIDMVYAPQLMTAEGCLGARYS